LVRALAPPAHVDRAHLDQDPLADDGSGACYWLWRQTGDRTDVAKPRALSRLAASSAWSASARRSTAWGSA